MPPEVFQMAELVQQPWYSDHHYWSAPQALHCSVGPDALLMSIRR